MIKVLLDTSPLRNENATRGVGTYTRFLAEALATHRQVKAQFSEDMYITDFEPELVHYPFFDLFFSTLPAWRKYPTVVTVHDVIPLIFPKEYRPGIKGTLRFWQQRRTLRQVQAVITDSESSKGDIIEHLKIAPEKIHVIYLAANPRLHHKEPIQVEEVRRKYHLPKNYILYVGDINYNKNLPQLIKALKFLPNSVKLVCVGRNFVPKEIPEWKAIEIQMALSNVAERVHFVPNLTGDATDDLAAIYSGAVLYVQPSLYEGFGLPVLEAMQCHTPVVCTKTSSLLEVGGEHVQFVDTDGESIANGIKEVWEWSANRRKQVVKAAAEWAASFTWQKTATQTIQVYEQVLQEQRRHAKAA